MRRIVKDIDQMSIDDSRTSNSSFIITDKEIQKARKRKKAAFQSFLSKPQPDPEDNSQRRRKLSDHQMQESNEQDTKCCNICNKILSDKVKVCQFCKQTLCIVHFRKARRNPNTNKFSRICDLCEDKYLMEKHYRNQMKTEETIVSEQEVLTIKYDKIKSQVEQKRRNLANTRQRNQSILEKRKTQFQNIIKGQNQIKKQVKNIQKIAQQNRELESIINALDKQLPPSLEADYQLLKEEKDKLGRQLNKFKKQIENCLKQKVQLQKKMYDDLYQWELIQKYKKKTEQKKKEEQCNIY